MAIRAKLQTKLTGGLPDSGMGMVDMTGVPSNRHPEVATRSAAVVPAGVDRLCMTGVVLLDSRQHMAIRATLQKMLTGGLVDMTIRAKLQNKLMGWNLNMGRMRNLKIRPHSARTSTMSTKSSHSEPCLGDISR